MSKSEDQRFLDEISDEALADVIEFVERVGLEEAKAALETLERLGKAA